MHRAFIMAALAAVPLGAQTQQQEAVTCRAVVHEACAVFDREEHFTPSLLSRLPWHACVEEIRKSRGEDLRKLAALIEKKRAACAFPGEVASMLAVAYERAYFDAELAPLGCEKGMARVRKAWAAGRLQQPMRGAHLRLAHGCIIAKGDWQLLESLLRDENPDVRHQGLLVVPMGAVGVPEVIRQRIAELARDPFERVRVHASLVLYERPASLGGWNGDVEQGMREGRFPEEQRRMLAYGLTNRGCTIWQDAEGLPRISCPLPRTRGCLEWPRPPGRPAAKRPTKEARHELEQLDTPAVVRALESEVAKIREPCGLTPGDRMQPDCGDRLRQVQWARVHAALLVLRDRDAGGWRFRAMLLAPVSHEFLQHHGDRVQPLQLAPLLADIFAERELGGAHPEKTCAPLWAANRKEDHFKRLACARMRKSEFQEKGWAPRLLSVARSPNFRERASFLGWVRERPDPRAFEEVLRLQGDPQSRGQAEWLIRQPTCGRLDEREAFVEAVEHAGTLLESMELRALVELGLAARGCTSTKVGTEVRVTCDETWTPAASPLTPSETEAGTPAGARPAGCSPGAMPACAGMDSVTVGRARLEEQ